MHNQRFSETGEAHRWTYRQESRSADAGFTLVEMVTASALFVIVLGAIYSLLQVGIGSRQMVRMSTNVQQNMRVAMDSLRIDAENAGHDMPIDGLKMAEDRAFGILGISNTNNPNPNSLPAVIPGDSVNVVNGVNMDRVSFVYPRQSIIEDEDGIPFASGNGSGPYTLALLSDDSKCRAGDIYMALCSTGQAGLVWLTQKQNLASPPRVQVNFQSGTGDLLDLNKTNNYDASTGDVTGTGPIARLVDSNSSRITGIRPVIFVTYFISPDGTLIRRQYGSANNQKGLNTNDPNDGAWLDLPMAQRVGKFDIQYILSDGSMVASPQPDQFIQIRQVKVVLQINSTETDLLTKKPVSMQVTQIFNASNVGVNKKAFFFNNN